MTSFEPGRVQDAWFVLRGFAYQVDVTLHRWLTLDSSADLLLECGEDIDHVAHALSSRTLEQIKRRDGQITLRDPAVVMALVNFIQHRHRNPGQSLRYRFTTSAAIGMERPPVLVGIPIPGITLMSRAAHPEEHDTRTALRRWLSAAQRPRAIHGAAWDTAWQTYLTFWTSAPDDQIQALLLDMEWSCGSPLSADLQKDVERLLFERGLVSTADAATFQYPRLFLHVMRLLSTPGEKRLRAEDLSEVLAASTWSPEDAVLYQLVKDLEGRVGTIERAQAKVGQRVEAVQVAVEALAVLAGVDVNVTYLGRALPPLTPPPLPDLRSSRTESVAALLRDMGTATWLSLHGVIGLGKSELSHLVAADMGGATFWVDFQGLDETLSCARLDMVTHQLSMSGLGPGGASTNQSSSPRAGDVVVLDDFPSPRLPDLIRRLRAFHQHLQARQVRLISTGHHPLPGSLTRDGVGVISLPAPEFTQQEVQDVLLAQGMPPSRQYAAFIRNLTSGHASLVLAASQFLKDAEWRLSDGVLSELLARSYGEEVQRSTFERLLDTVTDVQARELLYRLTLVRAPFQLAEVRVVAEVAPVISQPREKFTRLTGLWVQARGGQRYAVAPVVSHVGADLPQQVREATQLALAEELLTHTTLDQDDAEWAVLYLMGARAYDRAGLMWMVAVTELRRHDLPFVPSLYRLWIDRPLPEGMKPGYGFLIRMIQLQTCCRSETETAFVLDDLRRIAPRIPVSDNWPLAMAFQDQSLARVDFQLACQLARQLMNVGLRLEHDDPEKTVSDALRNVPEGLPIILTISIRSVEDVLNWLKLANEAMRLHRYPLDSESGWPSIQYVADWLFMHEFNKPAGEQNWLQVLDDHLALAEQARTSLLPTFWVRVVEAQVIILSEHLDDLPRALQCAKAALTACSTAEERLILNEVAGRQCFLKKRYAEALPWLEAAVAQPSTRAGDVKVKAGMMLSACLGRVDPQAAARTAQQVAQEAQEMSDVDLPLRARAYGEAALETWAVDDRLSAYWLCVHALEVLHQEEEDSPSWREPYVKLLTFVTLCVQDIAQGEQHLKLNIEGGGPGFMRHSFGAVHPEVAQGYSEMKRGLEEVVFGQFASLVGLQDEAVTWWRQGLSNPYLTLVGVGTTCQGLIPPALRQGDDTAVVHLARRSATALVVGMQVQDLTTREVDISGVLNEMDRTERTRIEEIMLMTGVLAAAYQMVSDIIHDGHQGRARSLAFAHLCLAEGKDSEIQEAWIDTAEAFMAMGSSLVTPATKLRRANAAASAGRSVTAVVWQLALSLDHGVPVRRLLEMHVNQLDNLQAWWNQSTSGLEHIALASLMAFWREKITRLTGVSLPEWPDTLQHNLPQVRVLLVELLEAIT